jgi:hypothetical protein
MRFKFYFIACASGIGRIMIGMEREKSQKLTILHHENDAFWSAGLSKSNWTPAAQVQL